MLLGEIYVSEFYILVKQCQLGSIKYMYLLHLIICGQVCSLQKDEKPQIAKFVFRCRHAGMVKLLYCTCCSRQNLHSVVQILLKVC